MHRNSHVLVLIFTLFVLLSSACRSPFSLRTIPEDAILESFADALSSEDDIEYFRFVDDPEFEEDFKGVRPTMGLIESCRRGNLRDLEISLVHGDLSWQDVMEAFIEACYYGQVQAVKLILEDTRVIPSLDDNACLRAAIEGDHPAVVQVLLEDGRLDVAAEDYYVVRLAYLTGRSEMVKMLLGHRGTNLIAALLALKPYINSASTKH